MTDPANIMMNAVCCVFPDGTVFWTDDAESGPSKAAKAWRSTLTEARKAELTDAGATIGAVVIRMPAKDYLAIQASNNGMTVAASVISTRLIKETT